MCVRQSCLCGCCSDICKCACSSSSMSCSSSFCCFCSLFLCSATYSHLTLKLAAAKEAQQVATQIKKGKQIKRRAMGTARQTCGLFLGFTQKSQHAKTIKALKYHEKSCRHSQNIEPFLKGSRAGRAKARRKAGKKAVRKAGKMAGRQTGRHAGRETVSKANATLEALCQK